ncbi:MAG: hypothetical protein AB7P02_05190 [Alphaproteobacteria bacterium]
MKAVELFLCLVVGVAVCALVGGFVGLAFDTAFWVGGAKPHFNLTLASVMATLGAFVGAPLDIVFWSQT